MSTPKGTFYCGTSNIVLPVANKSFYPSEYQDKSRLNYYSSLFNSLEINSSFYKIPMGRTVQKWADDVHDNFRFTFKLFRDITHARELNYDIAVLNKFLTAIDHAGNKMGCVLVQFPASISISYLPKVRQLLNHIHTTREKNDYNLAIEFRHKSWYRDEVYQMLEEYKASVVIHDMPASATPLIDMDASFVFMRFHGEKGDYKGSYSYDILEEHSGYIKDWLKEGKDVYTYFNNTIGDAVHNAITLRDLLKKKQH